MKIAIIGDIHGNKYALESVIEDIKSRKVDTILSTGDLVGYLPYPNEVIDLVKRNNILSIQGNHDEFFSTCEPVKESDFKQLSSDQIQANASRMFTNYTLTTDNRNFLKHLPKHVTLQFEHHALIVVHGSPRRNNEYMHETSDYLEDITNEVTEKIIVCGHTHVPYHKIINNKHIINAGSVGKPKHGNPNATYVLIDMTDQDINTNIVEVKYDVERLVEDIKHNDMISDQLIENLRQGR